MSRSGASWWRQPWLPGVVVAVLWWLVAFKVGRYFPRIFYPAYVLAQCLAFGCVVASASMLIRLQRGSATDRTNGQSDANFKQGQPRAGEPVPQPSTVDSWASSRLGQLQGTLDGIGRNLSKVSTALSENSRETAELVKNHLAEAENKLESAVNDAAKRVQADLADPLLELFRCVGEIDGRCAEVRDGLDKLAMQLRARLSLTDLDCAMKEWTHTGGAGEHPLMERAKALKALEEQIATMTEPDTNLLGGMGRHVFFRSLDRTLQSDAPSAEAYGMLIAACETTCLRLERQFISKFRLQPMDVRPEVTRYDPRFHEIDSDAEVLTRNDQLDGYVATVIWPGYIDAKGQPKRLARVGVYRYCPREQQRQTPTAASLPAATGEQPAAAQPELPLPTPQPQVAQPTSPSSGIENWGSDDWNRLAERIANAIRQEPGSADRQALAEELGRLESKDVKVDVAGEQVSPAEIVRKQFNIAAAERVVEVRWRDGPVKGRYPRTP